jgi:hypothetical protein
MRRDGCGGAQSGRRTLNMVPRWTRRFLVSVSLAALVCVFLLPPCAIPLELTNLELVFEKSFRQTPTIYRYGRSVSSAGDVNADGYDDIIVAWASYDTLIPVRPWLAKAFIFFGGNPMDTIPDVILTGDRDGEAYVEVCGAGDVNSDGFDDIVLSNHSMEAVRLFFGGDPMDTTYDVLLMNNVTYSFANSLSPAGDVNGDGYPDVIVGNYLRNSLNGSAAIFFGGPGLDGQPDVILNGHRDEGFGMQVAGGGDLNCDGYDDVVVGEVDNSESAPGAGKIYVFFGGSPMDTIPDVWMYGEGGGHNLGWCELGIMKMDGICDWVVAGTPFYPYGFPALAPGKVYMLFGDTLMDGVPDATIIGRTDSTSLGECSASGGRPCGGSFDAVLSGAPSEYGIRGSVYLWLSQVPFDTVPDAIATGSFPEQSIGWDVACAGDVNGDGYDEIMFSNCATIDSIKAVWICRYTGTGVSEEKVSRVSGPVTRLLQSSPNPFSILTTISYILPAATDVTLAIYDITGRLVETLVNETQQPGIHQVRWNRKSNPSGVYFYRLRAGEFAETRKMVVVE